MLLFVTLVIHVSLHLKWVLRSLCMDSKPADDNAANYLENKINLAMRGTSKWQNIRTTSDSPIHELRKRPTRPCEEFGN